MAVRTALTNRSCALTASCTTATTSLQTIPVWPQQSAPVPRLETCSAVHPVHGRLVRNANVPVQRTASAKPVTVRLILPVQADGVLTPMNVRITAPYSAVDNMLLMLASRHRTGPIVPMASGSLKAVDPTPHVQAITVNQANAKHPIKVIQPVVIPHGNARMVSATTSMVAHPAHTSARAIVMAVDTAITREAVIIAVIIITMDAAVVQVVPVI